MNSDMPITWWHVKTQKLMEMILMVLREQQELTEGIDEAKLRKVFV